MIEKNKHFIKNLKLINFKSFKDSIEIGPFNPHSNVIVGPNGIGKSNILDSILFTFGKKATYMRMKRQTDLINKTSKQNFASSSIFLRLDKTGSNVFFLKSKELSLTRRIYKSGTSNFYLNGNKINTLFLKKLFLFLKFPFNKKIFSIKQGELEQYINMEPSGKAKKKKGVLEVIEENSNSSNYFNHILKILKTVKGYKEKKELTFGDIILNFKDIEFDLIAQKKKRHWSFLEKIKIKKIFLVNEIFSKMYITNNLKILKFKNSKIFTKKILIVFKKIQKTMAINFCSLNSSCGLFFSKSNKLLKRGELQYLFQIQQNKFFNLILNLKKIKVDRIFINSHIQNLAKNLHKKLSSDIPAHLSSFSPFFSFRGFIVKDLKKKIKIIARVLSNVINNEPDKFLKVFKDELIKTKKVKILFEIRKLNFKKRYLIKKRNKIYTKSEQSLILNTFLKKTYFSNINTLIKIKFNYSISNLKKKTELFEKIIFNLKFKEDKKHSILKEKCFLINPNFISKIFTEISLTLSLGILFKCEPILVILKNKKILLSWLLFLRNISKKRFKIIENRKNNPFENSIVFFNNYNKTPSHLNRKFCVLEKFFNKLVFYIENFEKTCLSEKKYFNKIRIVKINEELLDFSKNLSSNQNLRNKLLFLYFKKSPLLYWSNNFLFYFEKTILDEKILKKRDNYCDNENVFFFNPPKNLKHALKKPGRDFENKKNFLLNRNLLFKSYNICVNFFSKNTDFLYFGKNYHKKIFEIEKFRILISILPLWLICTSFKRSRKDILDISWNFNKNLSRKLEISYLAIYFQNRKLKTIILEKNLNHRKDIIKTDYLKINLKSYNIIENIYYFLIDSVFFNKSINLLLCSLILKLHKNKISSLIFKKLEYLKIRIWNMILYIRLFYLKSQILRGYNRPKIFLNFKKFLGFDFIEDSSVKKTFENYFHKLLIYAKNEKPFFYKRYIFNFATKKNRMKIQKPVNILQNFLKRNIFENKVGRFKTEILKFKFSHLSFRNIHLIKSIDCHVYLKILNEIMKKSSPRILKYYSIEICSINESDIFLEGLKIKICNRNHKINNLFQMSGGERTICSLCFILSSQFFSHMKFYIFDEIDSALDFKNIKRISFEIKYQAQRSQVFFVSLRNNMILNINHIFGIFKIKNKTKLIGLRI